MIGNTFWRVDIMINPAGSLDTFKFKNFVVQILNLVGFHAAELSLMLAVLLRLVSTLRIFFGASNNVDYWNDDR